MNSRFPEPVQRNIMIARSSYRNPASGSTSGDNLTWSHPRVLVLLGIVFLLGASVGVTGTRAYLHARMFHRPDTIAMRLASLKAELHLTPEQEKTVTRELDDYAKYYQNIEEERMDVAQHGKQRILAVLNPDQQKRFLAVFDQLTR